MSKKPMLPSSRWYWIVLLLVLIIAAWTFITGYDFSLPYIDHPDEPAFNLAAQMILDSGSAQGMSFHAYPPGIIYTNFLALKFFHDGTGLPSEVLPQVRLITAFFAILTVLPLVALTYQAFDEWASLLAGLIWICTPYVVESLRYAIPNAYLTFFVLTALVLAFYALAYNRSSLATLANFSIMLAIVFKTQAIFLMPMVLALPLLRLRWYPDDRAAIIKSFIINSLRMSAFLFGLLVFYPTLRANEIPYWVAPTTTIGVPSASILWENFRRVYQALLHAPLSFVVVLPYLLLLLPEIRQRINLWALVYIVIASATWLFGISLFGLQDIRQSHTLMALLIALQSGSFLLVAMCLQLGLTRLQKDVNTPSRFHRLVAYSTVFGLVIAALLPTVHNNINHIISLTKPDSRVAFARYIDSSIPPASYITTYENHKTLNPFWGGIPLAHEYQMFKQGDLDAEPLHVWHDAGVEYAIVPYVSWIDATRYQVYRDEVTVLKTVEPSDLTRGPSMVLLYLHSIQNPLSGAVGDIRYVGYDVSAETVTAGESVSFRYYWQADNTLTSPYHVFNHLIGADPTAIIAQVDAAPLFDERRSTDTWNDPDEILLSRVFTLTIPPDTPAGTYTLISGFYEAQSFQRLQSEAGDFVTITTITVNEAD